MIPYEKLTFANDFLFCKIMESRPDLCKELIFLLLGRKVKEIRNVRSQLTVKETIGGKGVRFDIVFEDDESTVYDFEMQTTDRPNLAKRTRYYQGMLDASSIEQGLDYEELQQSFIIFICTFDPFGAGRHLYSFENRCVEDLTLPLGDETKKVFLSTEGDQDDVSPAVREFLDYVAGRSVTGQLAESLDVEVQRAKEKEEWRAEYMMNNAVIMDARREGLIEGRAQGRVQGRTEGQSLLASVLQRLKNGETPEAIRASGVDEDTVSLALTCR